MIPKKIHYVWVGGGRMNKVIKRCLDSWQKVLPDYEFKLWNEENMPQGYPTIDQMLKYEKWALISDFLRLYALYHEGGIYLDTDVELVKPLEPFLNDQCFIGFQEELPTPHWVNCAIMGAEPQHHFVWDCLDLYNKSQMEDIVPLIGPEISTRILKRYGLKDYGNQEINGVKVYETEYFYPYHFLENFTEECITANTHGIHHWQISWDKHRTMREKKLRFCYRLNRAFFVLQNSIRPSDFETFRK